MGKTTDRQRKKIIADYVQFENYSAVARLHGVSRNTVKAIVLGDEDTSEKCRLKKEQNMAAVLEHMSRQKDKVCGLLDRLIEAMDDPAKMDGSTLPQLATTLGILVDKYTANEARTNGIPQGNNIFEVIDQSTKEEIDTDAIPEVEPPTKSGHDLVE